MEYKRTLMSRDKNTIDLPFDKVDTLQDKMRRWDTYFMNICDAVSTKSPCLSRKIGALIVRNKSIVSTGFNGPARGHPHCTDCKRRAMDNYESGENLRICPAAHAEANCIANAAKIGASTDGGTLYLNTDIPCKDCMNAIVNAGIIKVISLTYKVYHRESIEIASYGKVKLRKVVI